MVPDQGIRPWVPRLWYQVRDLKLLHQKTMGRADLQSKEDVSEDSRPKKDLLDGYHFPPLNFSLAIFMLITEMGWTHMHESF